MPLTYPLWPALHEKCPRIKRIQNDRIILAKASVHLSHRTCVKDCLHWPVSCIFWNIGVILAKAITWIAHRVGVYSTKRVLVIWKGSSSILPWVVGTDAVLNTARARFFQVFFPQSKECGNINIFLGNCWMKSHSCYNQGLQYIQY